MANIDIKGVIQRQLRHHMLHVTVGSKPLLVGV